MEESIDSQSSYSNIHHQDEGCQQTPGGMSIFGFNDEDNDESLLVSPVLANYMQNSNIANTLYKEKENVITNTNQVNESITSLTSPASLNTIKTPSTALKSAEKRMRSSARLRRRKELLFSSPVGQNSKTTEGEGLDSSSKEDVDCNERRNTLLETSLCPSLGLGSTSNSSEEEEEESMDRKTETRHVNVIQEIDEESLSEEEDDDDEISFDETEFQENTFQIEDENEKSSSMEDEGEDSFGEAELKQNAFYQGMPDEKEKVIEEEVEDSFDESKFQKNTSNQENFVEDERDGVDSIDEIILQQNIHYQAVADEDGVTEDEIDQEENINEAEKATGEESIKEDQGDEIVSIEDTNIHANILHEEHENCVQEDKPTGDQNEQDTNELSDDDLSYSNIEDYVDSNENEASVENSSIHSLLEELEGVYSIPNKFEVDHNKDSHNSPEGQPTPSRSSTKAKNPLSKSLTPVLNAIRSKLLRNSYAADLEKEVSLSENDVELSLKSPSLADTTENTTSITPVLKSLRSKLYHGVTVEETAPETSHTPGNDKKLDSSNNTSLTPALKALRSKLLRPSSAVDSACKSVTFASDVSPIMATSDSPNVIENTSPYRSSLCSPPIREELPVKTPKTGSGKNISNVTDGDDSYLAQAKDLSSAKKNLNAHSSALVQRLKGAAQRRKVHLTQKRDSLAAKEIQHLERQESVTLMNEIIEEEESQVVDELDKNVTTQISTTMAANAQFKARPMPSNVVSGVPSRAKKAITKEISPKLGARRKFSSKSNLYLSKNQDRKSSTNSSKAKSMPKCTDGLAQGVQKAKKRQVTIPVSPLLGARRIIINRTSKETHNVGKHQTLKKNSKQIKKSQVLSPDLIGLGFLRGKFSSLKERENVPPSTTSKSIYLHSSERAKDRARFNVELAIREKERVKQKRMENEQLIKKRFRELEVLKQTLR